MRARYRASHAFLGRRYVCLTLLMGEVYQREIPMHFGWHRKTLDRCLRSSHAEESARQTNEVVSRGVGGVGPGVSTERVKVLISLRSRKKGCIFTLPLRAVFYARRSSLQTSLTLTPELPLAVLTLSRLESLSLSHEKLSLTLSHPASSMSLINLILPFDPTTRHPEFAMN